MGEFELLPGIFQKISDHEQTGTLQIEKDETETHLYFQSGTIKMVGSPHKRSPFAEGFMRCDEIDKATVESIFAKRRTSKKSLFEILKESDIPEEFKQENFIAKICQDQIGEEVYELISASNISCEFTEDQIPDFFDKELITLPISVNPMSLLMEAARRQDEWEVIRGALPSNKDIPFIFHKKDSQTSEGTMTEEEIKEKLEPLINELETFDELVEKTGKTKDEVIGLFVDMAKKQKLSLKKAKELKKTVIVLGVVQEIPNMNQSLKKIRMSYNDSVTMFIDLAKSERISLDNSKSLKKVLNILEMINGVRDFEEILELVRMTPFEAMKICAGLALDGRIMLKSAEELKQMVNLDILKTDISKCIKLYERVEELGIKTIDTMTWLAKAYEKIGLTNKAVEKYRELGATALDDNRYLEAVNAYKRVVEFAPEDLEAYSKLIHAYNKSGEREKAAEVSAIYARKVAVDDKRKAIMVLDQANKSFPSSPSNLELMATLYVEMNDKENAILTYNILAGLMKKQSDHERTLDAYKKILSIDPSNITAHLKLAEGLIDIEKIEEGVDQYKELGNLLIQFLETDEDKEKTCDILISVCECIIQYEPNNITAREWLVDSYIFRKDERTALNILRELLGLLQKEDNTQKLISNLRKVVTMDSEDFRSKKLLADTLLKQGKRSAAINEYMQLGVATYEKNDMRRAREAFDAIIGIDSFNLTARQKRAEILHNLNLQAKAVEEYKLIGYLAKSVGMLPEAIDAFSHVVELAPDKELWGFTEVAKLCETLEENKKAVQYHKSYAIKSLGRGNYGEVYYACSRILALDPNNPEALKMQKQAEMKFEKLESYFPKED